MLGTGAKLVETTDCGPAAPTVAERGGVTWRWRSNEAGLLGYCSEPLRHLGRLGAGEGVCLIAWDQAARLPLPLLLVPVAACSTGLGLQMNRTSHLFLPG